MKIKILDVASTAYMRIYNTVKIRNSWLIKHCKQCIVRASLINDFARRTIKDTEHLVVVSNYSNFISTGWPNYEFSFSIEEYSNQLYNCKIGTKSDHFHTLTGKTEGKSIV